MIEKDFTNDFSAKSWIVTAQGSMFPLQNIPFGVFIDDNGVEHAGTVIGDVAISFNSLTEKGFLKGDAAVPDPILYGLLYENRKRARAIRQAIFTLFHEGENTLKSDAKACAECMFPLDTISPIYPFEIRGYVDFYSSENHASNVGKMFRPQGDSLLPNWKHLPVAYNGRASSIILANEDVTRPCGQTKPADRESPVFGPTKELDFELEIGSFVGCDSALNVPITTDEVADYVLGLVLVNDWSARDIQRWEYQPLGPFLAKSFATSISPWIVTLEALEPFRVSGPIQEPAVLPYLMQSEPWHYDISLEVLLQTQKMSKPQVVCSTNFRTMYWSLAQQLAHMTVNGCDVEMGDLFASGTISGAEPGTYGSMLELSWKGEKPITLSETGETRTFIEDGDVVTMRGWCERDKVKIGFGDLANAVIPANAPDHAFASA